MSDTLHRMKELYLKANLGEFIWKPVHANNMVNNPVIGIYTDMFFKDGNKFQYLKYTIEYMDRCDAEGISHPAEGTKYYVLHELSLYGLAGAFEIPEPTEGFKWEDDLGNLVNNYGRFRYVFDDEETPKSVVKHELLHMIYLSSYLLKDEEREEWNKFIKEQEGNEKNASIQ